MAGESGLIIMLDALYLTIGLVLLVCGGELLLTYSVRFAQIIRISTIWISVVIISFGTSAPELIVSMDAAYQNLPDIAVGNVIGSNIANTLLVLGLAAVIQPIDIKYAELKIENYLLLFVFLMFSFCAYQGQLLPFFTLACLASLIVYIWYSYKNHQLPTSADENPSSKGKWRGLFSLIFAILGLLLLIGGAELLVMGAVGIARLLKVSEAVISLSIVAVGTSLPELVTAIFAARKKQNYITLANVVGSNLFNLMVVLGITSLFFVVPIGREFIRFDIWVLGALTLLLFGMMLYLKRITRFMGVGLLTLYFFYITYIYLQNM